MPSKIDNIILVLQNISQKWWVYLTGTKIIIVVDISGLSIDEIERWNVSENF